jgi:hypothetical protein
MKAHTAGIGVVAALAMALPGTALGQEEASSVVPPENSAATQYTEALPTAGGDKETGDGGRKPTPAKVLGTKNAKRLESQGQEGREVARVVAETAPEPTSTPAPTPPPQESSRQRPETPQGKEGDRNETAVAKPDKQSGPPGPPKASVVEPKQASSEVPDGSSGLAEVIAEATGSSSSGQLGALLPLTIIAVIAWSLGYFWRQRRPVE